MIYESTKLLGKWIKMNKKYFEQYTKRDLVSMSSYELNELKKELMQEKDWEEQLGGSAMEGPNTELLDIHSPEFLRET
jgi:hypothetical protein